MIQIDQLKVPVKDDVQLNNYIANKLKIKTADNESIIILKRSVDASYKPDINYVYNLAVKLCIDEKRVLGRLEQNNNIKEYHQKNCYSIQIPTNKPIYRPVVIGAGPAGLFAAYVLALANLNPIILERGKMVEDRINDVNKFWDTGILDISSNVQFGEGGAGTFSDGKLNTLVNDKNGRNTFVLETFVKFGANEDILYEGKPHIGTDILLSVIANMRKEIIRLGGEFHYSSQVTNFIINNNRLDQLEINGTTLIDGCDVVVAIGHSARDTFSVLHDLGVEMEAKDFAVGFRIEHPQKMISISQYGEKYYDRLSPANYKLTTNLSNGRGVYSFCMCPGGYVVNSSSEKNRLVVNGMSYRNRGSSTANSAIVVTVGSKEFDKNDALSSIKYQRSIEEKAFNICGGWIPQQLFNDFKKNIKSSDYGDFESNHKGNANFGNLRDIFSDEINDSLITAIENFGNKIRGYNRDDAILSGVESRTSSPVRINRDVNFLSNILGLYPCGEGAGYAGGITSAAMDGIKVAEAIINRLKG